MDGDSIPRCTIAARSLRRVLLRGAANTWEFRVPSSSRLAWFHILRSGAAQTHEDNAENGRRGETAHGEVIAIRVCSGNRLHPR